MFDLFLVFQLQKFEPFDFWIHHVFLAKLKTCKKEKRLLTSYSLQLRDFVEWLAKKML